ncbi:ATP-binding protein [Streptomyces candidus]|uniref:Putative ATPase n=1 Tax=Streptomyces candidus TaxID=67283 RepID=A0A7X0HAM9_9ACTN|nr:AAA family ATPase [Streptomyces candidus]MBB6434079.1 putative ATPase [Streptomyces candidus]
MAPAYRFPTPRTPHGPGLGSLLELLAETRLVTLTGPAGVGKSHLAARLAETVTDLPVHHCDLSDCADAALVPQTVAAALHAGTAPGSGTDPMEAVLRLLAGRRGLLVLDTCERVRAGCAYLVGRLHDSCPGLQILLTSRTPIGVPGEQRVPLHPLSREHTVELLREKAAMQGVDLPVFWTRLLAERLDGDPLSVLLAARTLGRATTPQQLYGSLCEPGARFGVLIHGPQRPARHRTLLRSIAWSHDLCGRAERLLWARLSAFTGSFTAEQVRTVFASDEELAALVDASVVLAEDDGSYRLPLAHREYGQLLLAEPGKL